MFKNLICSRRKNNKLKADRAANRRRNRTRLLQGMQSLEDRRLLAVTTLPFFSVADFNQFDGDTDPEAVSLGFGITDGPGGVPDDPTFLGLEFEDKSSLGGFTAGFSGKDVGAKVDLEAEGRLGLEYGYYISKGAASIINEGTFQYDIAPIAGSEKLSLSTSSIVAGSTLNTVSPTISAYADIVVELDALFAAQACGGILGCTPDPVAPTELDGVETEGVGTYSVDIAQTIPLVSLNRQTEESIASFSDPDQDNFVDFDGAFKLLGIPLGQAPDIIEGFTEARDAINKSETDEAKAINALKNAKNSAERDQARKDLNKARADIAAEKAKQTNLKEQVDGEAGSEKNNPTRGLALEVSAVDTGLFGVKVSAAQEIGGVGRPVGELTLTVPEVNLTSSLASGGDLFASTKDPIFNEVPGENEGDEPENGALRGQNQIVDLSLNLGTFLSNQIPGIGTTTVSVGPIDVSLTTVDYILSAVLDVQQEFQAIAGQETVFAAFSANPLAELDGNPVNASELAVTQEEADLYFPGINKNRIIKFTKGADITISPANFNGKLDVEFVLERSYAVDNSVALGFAVNGKLEALKASAEGGFGPLSTEIFDIGPLIELDHELLGFEIPVFQSTPYQAKPAATFDTQSIDLGPDISTSIGDTSEIITDDPTLATDGEFAFDVVLENVGLQTAQPSMLDLTQLNLDDGDFQTDSIIGTINGSGNDVRTFEFAQGFSIEPGESVTVSFTGTTELGAGTNFNAIATVLFGSGAEDVSADNNSAETNLRILESRKFFVSRGDDTASTGSPSCTIVGGAPCSLREAVEAANNFGGDNPLVIVIGEGVPTVTLESGIVLQESVAIFGQGIDATKIQAHPTLFPEGKPIFTNLLLGEPDPNSGNPTVDDLPERLPVRSIGIVRLEPKQRGDLCAWQR